MTDAQLLKLLWHAYIEGILTGACLMGALALLVCWKGTIHEQRGHPKT